MGLAEMQTSIRLIQETELLHLARQGLLNVKVKVGFVARNVNIFPVDLFAIF
jgi:hypothetical protein